MSHPLNIHGHAVEPPCEECGGLGWMVCLIDFGEDFEMVPCECDFAYWHTDRLLSDGAA